MPFEDSEQFYERTRFAGRNCIYHDKQCRPGATLIADFVGHHHTKLLHAAAAADAAFSAAASTAVDTAAAAARFAVHTAAVAAAERLLT